MVVDFHTHILPGIDDGSKSVEMSKDMIQESFNQGVEAIVLSPHFYPDRMKPDVFLRQRDKAYEQIANIIGKSGIDFYIGVEVYFSRGISEWEILDKFCISGTNLILIEMPFRQWTEKDIEEISNLRYRGVRPVIAHIERFIPYQKDEGPLNTLLDMELIYQFNVEGLLNFFGKNKILKLMGDTTNVILGSDCHNTDKRPQNISKGRKIIAKKLGEDYLKTIDELSYELLVNKINA